MVIISLCLLTTKISFTNQKTFLFDLTGAMRDFGIGLSGDNNGKEAK